MAVLSTNNLTTAAPLITGVWVGVAASGGGDKFQAGSNVFFYVGNAGGSTRTITFASVVPCEQGGTHNTVLTLASGAVGIIGPFIPSRWADANGQVGVTYDSATGVNVSPIAVVS